MENLRLLHSSNGWELWDDNDEVVYSQAEYNVGKEFYKSAINEIAEKTQTIIELKEKLEALTGKVKPDGHCFIDNEIFGKDLEVFYWFNDDDDVYIQEAYLEGKINVTPILSVKDKELLIQSAIEDVRKNTGLGLNGLNNMINF